jgi:hypothetical protein
VTDTSTVRVCVKHAWDVCWMQVQMYDARKYQYVSQTQVRCEGVTVTSAVRMCDGHKRGAKV